MQTSPASETSAIQPWQQMDAASITASSVNRVLVLAVFRPRTLRRFTVVVEVIAEDLFEENR